MKRVPLESASREELISAIRVSTLTAIRITEFERLVARLRWEKLMNRVRVLIDQCQKSLEGEQTWDSIRQRQLWQTEITRLNKKIDALMGDEVTT